MSGEYEGLDKTSWSGLNNFFGWLPTGWKQHIYARTSLDVFRVKHCSVYLTPSSIQLNQWYCQLVTTHNKTHPENYITRRA